MQWFSYGKDFRTTKTDFGEATNRVSKIFIKLSSSKYSSGISLVSLQHKLSVKRPHRHQSVLPILNVSLSVLQVELSLITILHQNLFFVARGRMVSTTQHQECCHCQSFLNCLKHQTTRHYYFFLTFRKLKCLKRNDFTMIQTISFHNINSLLFILIWHTFQRNLKRHLFFRLQWRQF